MRERQEHQQQQAALDASRQSAGHTPVDVGSAVSQDATRAAAPVDPLRAPTESGPAHFDLAPVAGAPGTTSSNHAAVSVAEEAPPPTLKGYAIENRVRPRPMPQRGTTVVQAAPHTLLTIHWDHLDPARLPAAAPPPPSPDTIAREAAAAARINSPLYYGRAAYRHASSAAGSEARATPNYINLNASLRSFPPPHEKERRPGGYTYSTSSSYLLVSGPPSIASCSFADHLSGEYAMPALSHHQGEEYHTSNGCRPMKGSPLRGAKPFYLVECPTALSSVAFSSKGDGSTRSPSFASSAKHFPGAQEDCHADHSAQNSYCHNDSYASSVTDVDRAENEQGRRHGLSALPPQDSNFEELHNCLEATENGDEEAEGGHSGDDRPGSPLEWHKRHR